MATRRRTSNTTRKYDLREQYPTDHQQVRLGMALLDRVFGPAWALLIDLDTFDIEEGDRCVLGQIAYSADPRADSNEISEYGAMLDALANLNGPVQDFLYEHFVWDSRGDSREHDSRRYLIDSGCGFAGDVDNDLWIRAIRKRQRELGGERVAKQVRREWIEEARRGVNRNHA